MSHRISGPLLALALGLPLLQAHDTWLQAKSPAVPTGGTIELEMTSADGFNEAGSAIQPERVLWADIRLAGRTRPLRVGSAGSRSLALSISPDVSGVAVLGVELKPKILTLEPKLIEVYFEEIHAGDQLRSRWAALPSPKQWRERYKKHAKAFVRVGEPPVGDRTWADPLGHAVELIPEQDPTTLRVGDTFGVRLVSRGRPLAGLPLGFVAQGETSHHVVVTDAEGRASAVLDRPGRWLVHGTDLRLIQEPEVEWESDFVTLVVEVVTAGPR